ncbi:MAG: class I SAM-dependent methyltransferase [Chloroflexia bacterium]
MSVPFRDYFSAQSNQYAKYRPTYPPELFEFLASVVEKHELAWDCGTGNGQAAIGLAMFFERVIATDPSADQLRNAFRNPKVEYRQARGEDSGLEGGSVDMVTVAQALHWFEVEDFYKEVRRCVKPGGTIAIWGYALSRVSDELDVILDRFYYETVGPYWPKQREHMDAAYRSLSFPFEELVAPEFRIEVMWDLGDMVAYLRTWSPVQRYIEAHGEDPVVIVEEELEEIWGDPLEKRAVGFPVFMRVGMV